MAAKCHSGFKLEAVHISEMDSYDLHSESDAEFSGRRKGRKLLAEKRRRARINQCLNDIKNIVCDAQKNDPNYEKMEKAEILESTVDYLRNVRKINTTPQKVKETVQARFQQGFSRCAEEILSYVQSLPGVSDNVHNQLRKHLNARLGHVQQVPVTPSTANVPVTSSTYMTSQWQDRLGYVPSVYGQASGHAYMNVSVCPSPLSKERSLEDSGYLSSPEAKNTSPVIEYRQSIVVGKESSRGKRDSVVVDDGESRCLRDRRVSEWVASTLDYSKHVTSPWRPW